MPVRSDPQAATQKWVTNLSNAQQAMTRGVAAVQVSPGQLAAAAADKWLMKVQQSRDKFARRVGSVTLGDWQNAMTTYGIPRVAQGASAKQGKMQSFMAEYLPFLQSGVAAIDRMPKNTLEDGINRAVAMIRYNAGFQRRGQS
jgi:hypothetical protein